MEPFADTDQLRSSTGPFPRAPIAHPLERRWLHYAFITRDGARSVVANVAWLGAEEGLACLRTGVLLVYDREGGWTCSQWIAGMPAEPWSSFRVGTERRATKASQDFELKATKGWPSVALELRRTSTPGIGGCATFRDGWLRWQAEPGVQASGVCRASEGVSRPFEAIGYHERVRGCWGWPQLGGWVFGFCNHAPGVGDAPPDWSVVFALLQPSGGSPSQTCVLMLWRRGRLVRFIPRRRLRVSVAGQLDRGHVDIFPTQMSLLGTGPTAPIPAALCVDGFQGRDWVQLSFRTRVAARLVVPSETSLRPFSVHEVLGQMNVGLAINGRRLSFCSPAIVEFAGGAAGERSDVF